MRRRMRAVLAFALSIGVVLSLTSCSPATFVWGYIGEGSELRLAFCSTAEATMARVTVSERPERELVEVQSAVWSGPRIRVSEGAILASDALPAGWQSTGYLDLAGQWDRIDVSLYDGAEYVDYAILSNSDVGMGEWSLSPRPTFLTGSVSCSSPYDATFERVGGATDSVDSAVAAAGLVAMPEDEFWKLISVFDVATFDDAVRTLVEQLALLPTEQVDAFHAQLMLQYFALDTARVWNESERQWDSYDELGLSTTEAFADLRSAIIRGGQDSVEAALSGRGYPPAIREYAYPGLPGVAAAAHVAAGDLDTTTSISLSISMGMNDAGW